VAVNHGSTLVFSTTVGGDRGANAAADAGSRTVGIMTYDVRSVYVFLGMRKGIRVEIHDIKERTIIEIISIRRSQRGTNLRAAKSEI
jgi:hypothetical protein